jgi:hypothetical protein
LAIFSSGASADRFHHVYVAGDVIDRLPVSLWNIAIHALVMTSIVQCHPSWLLIGVMVSIVSVLMVIHLREVSVWALSYLFVDATPAGSDVLYFAFVSYTTLGCGDITPVDRWKLFGPLTAMSGVLLFGWGQRSFMPYCEESWPISFQI